MVEYKVPIESRQAYKVGKGGATCTPLDKKLPSYCRPWGLHPGCADDRYNVVTNATEILSLLTKSSIAITSLVSSVQSYIKL